MATTYFADKPTIDANLVQLRPFTSADIEDMGPILADPDVLCLTATVHTSAETADLPTTLDQPTRKWYQTRAEQGDRLDLAVVDRATGRCVGEVVLNELSEANASCSYRVLIGPAGQNRGLGTEATRLIIDHAFSTTPLHRIDLEVYSFNPRAQRVYERAGFVIEGRKREAFTFDGERIDAIVMAILRPEWAAGR